MTSLIKIGTIKINTFLPTRNKFVDYCSEKIGVPGFDDFLESGTRWARGLANMKDEAKVRIKLLKWSFFDVCPLVVMEKDWALSVDPCLLQAEQFSVHRIELFGCNGFGEILKAVVDHTGSRPQYSDHDLFFVQFWLWKVLCSFFLVLPLSQSSPVLVEYSIFVTLHNLIDKCFTVVA